MTALAVVAVGPATSVQDGGRFGAQRYGLTPSGAIDRRALAAANVLVGNAITTPAVEIGPFPATFTARHGAIRIALAGAERQIRIGDRPLPMLESATVADGETLVIGAARDGVFSVLAIEGRIEGTPVFGSFSVNARVGLGTPYPRPLQAGDELGVAQATQIGERRLAVELPAQAAIRVVAGPQADDFGDAFQLFIASEWTVSPASDRMGYRLQGPRLVHAKGHNIVSDGTVNGSIQVPGNGQPLVLMPDRGTSGGYPKIATVINPDLGLLAQRPVGQPVRFFEVSVEQAQEAARKFADMIKSLPNRLLPVRSGTPDIAALLAANLAGSAVNAFDAATWQTAAPSGSSRE